MVDFSIHDKKAAIEASNDLTRRIAGEAVGPGIEAWLLIAVTSELGQCGSVEPGDSLGHLQIKELPELGAVFPPLPNQKYYNTGPRSSNTAGYM